MKNMPAWTIQQLVGKDIDKTPYEFRKRNSDKSKAIETNAVISVKRAV